MTSNISAVSATLNTLNNLNQGISLQQMRITNNIHTGRISIIEVTLDDFSIISAALGMGSLHDQKECKDLLKRMMDGFEELHKPESVEDALKAIESSQNLRSKLGID